ANPVMARLMRVPVTEALVGRPIAEVAPCIRRGLAKELMRDFVEAGYSLRNRETSLSWANGAPRHFIVNAVGTVEKGRLVRIWGSIIEVTDRVELERQMVKELERQQHQIGRDLHDGVGQFLTGVRMLSTNLMERYFDEPHEGRELA